MPGTASRASAPSSVSIRRGTPHASPCSRKGWLPAGCRCSARGWGLPQDGEGEHGVIAGGAWSDASAAPAAPVGELWLVHQSGSFVKLTNDGTVRVNGDLHVNGDVYDRHGSLDRLRGNYDAHTHGGVISGGSNTAATSNPDSE